jgi:hypothetical protein
MKLNNATDNYNHIQVNTDDNKIVWLALNLKDESTNVLNPEIIVMS